jgi:ligand-binding SRPBCC domain-containing protein
MIVNVCPTAIAHAPPEAVWQVLVDTEHYGDWADAQVVSVDPAGPACSGQRIELAPRALGRRWHASIEIGRLDNDRRWIDMVARTPFGVVNREHITLTTMGGGRTMIRFN